MDYTFFDFLKLIGSLCLFLYGMKVMSEGLQKAAGDRLRSILSAMTSNRFAGVLTGVLITALIQSSSATTVMVVSFVNAQLLTLTQSISVIMGANIGTTVTAWLISIFGFKVDMGALALPILAFTIPLLFSKKSNAKSIGEFMLGFALLFMGLSFLKSNAPDLNANPEMLSFVQKYTNLGFGSVLLFLFIGTIITIIIQSSSATMAITLIMCSSGWISLELGAALVLGENIGTTITANVAALTGNAQARRAALAHFVFNIFGVIWVLVLFHPFMHLINWIVDNYFATNNYAIWFIPLIEKLVCQLITSDPEEEDYRLKYISSGLLSTSELSILQARKEINLFAERTARMFSMNRELLNTKKTEEFSRIYGRIEKYESISDNMELEIASYLGDVSNGRLSNDGKEQIQSMLREISEIESIGDSCFNIARTLNRKRQTGKDFTEKQYAHISSMMDLVDQALEKMIAVAGKKYESSKVLSLSYDLENEINNFRDQLKTRNINDVEKGLYDYQIGVYYMDCIGDCEKLGDYILNVVQTKEKRYYKPIPEEYEDI